jgi:hypothetical protein
MVGFHTCIITAQCGMSRCRIMCCDPPAGTSSQSLHLWP